MGTDFDDFTEKAYLSILLLSVNRALLLIMTMAGFDFYTKNGGTISYLTKPLIEKQMLNIQLLPSLLNIMFEHIFYTHFQCSS